MGSMVLEAGERKQFLIIDGRQRLTTLGILILACVDYLIGLAGEGIDGEANRERANLLESSYCKKKFCSSIRSRGVLSNPQYPY